MSNSDDWYDDSYISNSELQLSPMTLKLHSAKFIHHATLLALTAINSVISKWSVVGAVIITTDTVPACATNMEEYLRLHAELSPLTDENEQQTVWDRSSLPNRDLTYPVENHPVPEGEAHLMGGRKRPKLRSRERRQISSGSLIIIIAVPCWCYSLPSDDLTNCLHTSNHHILNCYQTLAESCYLFFANQVHVIKMQNSPVFRIEPLPSGFSNAVAVDFDKR